MNAFSGGHVRVVRKMRERLRERESTLGKVKNLQLWTTTTTITHTHIHTTHDAQFISISLSLCVSLYYIVLILYFLKTTEFSALKSWILWQRFETNFGLFIKTINAVDKFQGDYICRLFVIKFMMVGNFENSICLFGLLVESDYS